MSSKQHTVLFNTIQSSNPLMDLLVTFIYLFTGKASSESNFHLIYYNGIAICTAVEYSVVAATRKRAITCSLFYYLYYTKSSAFILLYVSQ